MLEKHGVETILIENMECPIMVSRDDIVGVFLSPEQMSACSKHAELCSICGQSNVHTDKEERKDVLSCDQVVGQVCTCAATMWLGSSYDNGFSYYDRVRRKQNLTPYDGDGGDDIPPYRIDVKGSLVRNDAKDLLSYNLLVRPKERHAGLIYLMALHFTPSIVALVGWALETDLPVTGETFGVFSGAYRLSAASLRPVAELRTRLRNEKNR